MKEMYYILRYFLIYSLCGIIFVSSDFVVSSLSENLNIWDAIQYSEQGFGLGVSGLFVFFILAPFNSVIVTLFHILKVNKFILNNIKTVILESLVSIFIYWILFVKLYNKTEGHWYLTAEFFIIIYILLIIILLTTHGRIIKRNLSDVERR